MKFRVTIEQFIHSNDDCPECSQTPPYWKQITQKEVSILAAELAARQIERIISDEGLSINSNYLRQVLFDTLHEPYDNQRRDVGIDP